MSLANREPEDQISEEKRGKRRRRVKQKEGGEKRPIKLVSSLGEGKLLERFQNAMGEKEARKKSREKGEKQRKMDKEKKEREIARFQEEINALLEENQDPKKPNKKQNKVYVPALTGTVKGKFEELEKRNKREERSKLELERRHRVDRDLREKKMIQIELAKKKLQMKELGEEDDDSVVTTVKVPKKTPGKLQNNFEDIARQREERDQKKLELERKMRFSSELRAVKERKDEQESDEDSAEQTPETKISKTIPGKFQTNFDELFRGREEEERERIQAERREKLEEEKREFRAARLASGSGAESEASFTSHTSSSEKIRTAPKPLSSSFTKFEVLEKQRLEQERERIRERRRMLLEEEKRLFDKMRDVPQQTEDESGQAASDDRNTSSSQESNMVVSPGRLNSSLRKFEALSQEKLEEERKRIYEERRKLLEEEQKNFKQEQLRRSTERADDGTQETSESDSCESASFESDDEDAATDDNRDGLATAETRKKKLKKRRHKVKKSPSKLAYSKLKFDVLERQRLDKERLLIHKRRQELLEEEQKLFEESRKKRFQEEEDVATEDEREKPCKVNPGRLDRSFTEFDVVAKQRMAEKQEEIRRERARLLEEETKLMEEERRKLQEQEECVTNQRDDDSNPRGMNQVRMPRKLDKSLTEFDLMEKTRKTLEEEELYKQKAKRLEEEKQAFREAREIMEAENESDGNEGHSTISKENSCAPKKLSRKLTNFDVEERERIERERLRAQEEKAKRLESEIKGFEEQRKDYQDSDDDVTSATKALLKSHRDGPRPRRLASSLTQFDMLERQRREEERERMQREKAQRLEEERKMFEQCRVQSSEEASDNDLESERERKLTNNVSVKKMDVRSKIEAVMRAQEEAERKRIEETKFCRMTVEQQEMYLARQRQIEHLQRQLAETQARNSSDDETSDEEDDEYYTSDGEDYDDDAEEIESCSSPEDSVAKSLRSESASSSSSGTYSGSPYFVQELGNVTVNEGEPVRFDAHINASPHPKVTWYFQGRLIRNSADYQYLSKGSCYSLYMNESFFDDTGEYMCKAVNERGSAASKAILTVIEGVREHKVPVFQF